MNKITTFTILAAVFILHVLSNYFVISGSSYALGPDSIAYFEFTKHISQILSETALNLGALINSFTRILRLYPPVWKPPVYFLTASVFLLFDMSLISAVASNLIYLAILIFATYGIGKEIYNQKVGLLAAFLVTMFPTVFALSRIFMIDIALAAMVALTFYLFIINKFESLCFSLFIGLIIAIGALTKQSYYLYLLPILCISFIRHNFKRTDLLRNYFLAIFIGIIISASWYLWGGRLAFARIIHSSFIYQENLSPFYYIENIFYRQLLPVYSVLFFISFILSIKRKRYMLPIMIVFSLLVFSISPNKQGRFILPVLIYIAVLIAGQILSLSKTKKWLIVIFILFSLFQYFVISYRGFFPNFLTQFIAPQINNYSAKETGLFSLEDEGDWRGATEDIVELISPTFNRNTSEKKDFLIISDAFRQYTELKLIRAIQDLPLNIYKPNIDIDYMHLSKEFTEYRNFNKTINGADYIMLDNIGTNANLRLLHAKELHRAFLSNINNFRAIGSVYFPDDSSFVIYKNNRNNLVN